MVDDERSLAARLDFLHERVRDDMAVFRHGVGGHDDRLVALHTTRAEGPPSGWRQRHPPLTSVDGMVAEALTHHADPHSVDDFWCLYRRALSLDSNIFLAQGVISFELSNTGDANGSQEPDREPMTAGSTQCPALPATVFPVRWHARRCTAFHADPSGSPCKRQVRRFESDHRLQTSSDP